jgi:hypothetical protein
LVCDRELGIREVVRADRERSRLVLVYTVKVYLRAAGGDGR